MTILVTAASGHLGRLVLDALLERGVEPGDLRAGARRPETLSEYAARGVQVVPLDYTDAATVRAAVDGVDKVLLISGSEVGERVAQHGNVIDAAAAAGVGQLVYTSAPRATDGPLVLAPEHRATEELIAASGLPATILRNNWYTENYAQDLEVARDHGVLVTSAGAGRVPSAARADFAAAAAVVLTEEGHVGQVYELAGDVAWDFPTLAAAMSEVLGREVALEQLSPEERVAQLQQVGLDAGTAGFVAALEGNIRDGVLDHADGTLARLIGRPTTPLVDTLRTLTA
jgi:NAD(P)H dehydrogenase (quinone)